jgi:hypothetical protein
MIEPPRRQENHEEQLNCGYARITLHGLALAHIEQAA